MSPEGKELLLYNEAFHLVSALIEIDTPKSRRLEPIARKRLNRRLGAFHRRLWPNPREPRAIFDGGGLTIKSHDNGASLLRAALDAVKEIGNSEIQASERDLN